MCATVEEFSGRWLAIVAPERYRASYLRPVRSYLTHIRAFLGSKPVDEVTAEDADAFGADLRAKGLAPSTRCHILGVLRALFDTAVRWGLVQDDPTNGVALPGAESLAEDFTNFIEPSKVPAFKRAAQGRLHPTAYTAVWLALRLGLRPGEVAGLHCDDVVVGEEEVTVRVRRRAYEGQIARTKGNRAGAYPLELEEAGPLLEQLERAQDRGGPLLFPARDGKAMHHSTLTRWARAACEAAGMRPITAHGLRHTCGTLLAANGASDAVIMDFLRQATPAMVRRYTHLGGKERARAGTLLAACLR